MKKAKAFFMGTEGVGFARIPPMLKRHPNYPLPRTFARGARERNGERVANASLSPKWKRHLTKPLLKPHRAYRQ